MKDKGWVFNIPIFEMLHFVENMSQVSLAELLVLLIAFS
jgi:hypothetical protein